MKKIFLGLLAIMVSVTLFAERVSQNDAALVANNFMNVSSTVANSAVKKAPAKRMVLKANAEQNQFYVYENANGEGWVMVAADDVAHPILAYSLTGHFRTDNQPDNLKVWLRGYNRQITRASQDENYVANAEVQNEWRALRNGANNAMATPVVAPLIETGWDQDAPYWNKCPQKSGTRCLTGCVATAMAQVMNYHQWPKKGTGSHTIEGTSYSADFGNTTYDWDNMINDYSGSSTSAQKTAVATLMYHCGVAVDMEYNIQSKGGSGAYTIDYNGYWSGQGKMCAEKALTQFFGYKSSTVTGYYRDGDSGTGMRSWSKADWIAMLKEELDNNRPIMYAGAGCDDENDESTCYGHSFVCDGYDSDNMFHFNFGWSNSCDGYYDVDVLNTDVPGNGGGNGYYSLEQDVIVGIIPDKKDLPMITITWSVNGDETTTQIMQEDPLVLPETPANCEAGKVFVGWTAQSDVNGERPSDLFTSAAGKTVSSAVTYYAVYATAEGGGSSTNGTKTFTFASIASANSWVNSEAYTTVEIAPVTVHADGGGNNGKWYTSGNGSWRMYSGGTVRIEVDGGNVTSVTSSPSCDWTITDGVATFSPSARTDFTQITVNYTTGAQPTYSDYSLTCGAPVVCELTGITLNTDNVKKDFKTGEEFTYAGLVVTASFSNCANKTVTPTAVSTPDMSVAGQKTVTVTYTRDEVTKTNTYTINVVDPAQYLIRFFDNSAQIGADQMVTEGQLPEVPENPTAACADYTFVGWWTTTLAADNTNEYAWVYDFTATQAQDYYAIYRKSEAGEGGEAAFDGQTPGTYKIYALVGETKYYAVGTGKKLESTTNEAEATEYTFESVEGGFAIKTGSTYIKYANNKNGKTDLGTSADAYAWTVSSGTNGSWRVASQVSGRALIFRAADQYKFAGYSTSNVTATSDEYYDIEIGGGAPAATTYYSSVVSCGATAVENTKAEVKAVKVLENGQIVIIRDNEKYTIFGQKIQ